MIDRGFPPANLLAYTGWGVFEHAGCTYVIPVNDFKDHELTPECWCRPTPDEENPNLYVHHSMDGREDYEQGRKMQ